MSDPMLTERDAAFREACMTILGTVCQGWKHRRKVLSETLFQDLISQCEQIVGEIPDGKTAEIVASIDRTIAQIKSALKFGAFDVWPDTDDLFFEIEYIWSWRDDE